MSLLGRAIGRIASKSKGQSLLELPDDLSPQVVEGIVNGANSEIARDPSFALFVHENRSDLPSGLASVDFRELAMYREGDRLAVVYGSDNRGMATYTSVFPLLFSPGFPSSNLTSSANGIALLDDLIAELVCVLKERQEGACQSFDLSAVLGPAARFLTSAYQYAGNGQTSLAADWWQHIAVWAEGLANLPACGSEEAFVQQVYGAAGLPHPVQGSNLQMRPRDYVETLKGRWSDPIAIRQELLRLEGIPSAEDAAKNLSSIEWEDETSEILLRTDSQIARVALAGESVSDGIRREGWASLSESDFLESFVDAKGKLLIELEGQRLPRPWGDALPILPVGSTHETSIEFDDLGILVPWKDGVVDQDLITDAALEVEGLRGASTKFETTANEVRPDGLLFIGRLTVSPAKKSPEILALEAHAAGPCAAYIADRSDGMVALLGADDIVLQVRRTSKGSGPKTAFERNSAGAPSQPVKLGVPGAHEVALAFGEHLLAEMSTVELDLIDFERGWPQSNRDGLLIGRGDLARDQDIQISGDPVFSLEMAQAMQRPISPILAAAHGTLPDHVSAIESVLLGSLEEQMLACLAVASPGCALGHFLTRDSRERSEFEQVRSGVYADEKIADKLSELTPKAPSAELVASQEYEDLISAYRDLGLVQYIARLEEADNISGVTPSRISLSFITADRIDRLLKRYVCLMEASKSLESSDRFWARHPFSLAVYPDGIGNQGLSAVLLSPLHPIRLAWLWRLHVGLNASSEDDGDPASALALIDNTLFPALGCFENDFGETDGLLPVPIDAYPSDVYVGWHALVPVIGGKVLPPHRVNGDHFPINGLSGLSSSAVSSALDDFMRVAPQVRSIRVAVEAVEPTRRSNAIDDGLLEKIAELATSSGSLGSVGGIHVLDSKSRLGPIPSFERISEELELARAGFNAQWSVSPSNRAATNSQLADRTHLTFLEGLAANVAIVANMNEPTGWLPEVPLRRFPERRRPTSDQAALSYALNPAPSGDLLKSALISYEGSPSGKQFEVRIKPNLAALPNSPNWFVSGDFGIDPQAIASAAASQGNGRYMLWDWRPAATLKTSDRNASLRSQPYFVMASVPPTLTSAVSERIMKLDSTLDTDGVEQRVKRLVRTLATRAVGLNTLLAIGHHQATGALGFFFALQSLEKWMLDAGAEELRLVVPIDAADSFLRSVASNKPQSKRRADLLAIRAKASGGSTSICLIPIEIKHYGLNNLEQELSFPNQGEKRFKEHLEQLQSYQSQLAELCVDYRGAAGDQVSIMGQQLSAIMEAALQLSPHHEAPMAAKALSEVAGGAANIELGKGLLLWYQAGASSEEGLKAKLEETFGPPDKQRIDVWIDPAHHDAEIWEEGASDIPAGGAHDTVLNALRLASYTDDPVSDYTENNTSTASGEEHAGGLTSTIQATESPDASEGGTASNGAEETEVETASKGQGHAVNVSPKRMAKAKLEGMYKRLLNALAEFNVSVQRPTDTELYREGPAFIEFGVRLAYGVSVRKVESQLENVKMRLGLPGDATIGCTNHLGNLLLTVPKDDADRYFIKTSELWPRWHRPEKGFHIPLGEDINGDIVSIEFSNSNSPHLLIAGTTGSGKSEALLTLLQGAVHYYSKDELELHLIDPKQTELVSLEELPHCVGKIGWSAAEALGILGSAVEQMDLRYELFRENRVRDIGEYSERVAPMARQLIVLDEYADLTTDDEDRKNIEKQLTRLAQKARAAGIHVIVSTQKPVVSVINTVIKGNLPARVALKVSNGTESRVVLDETGAEDLAGKGDAYLKAGSGKVRLQFAQFDG